MSRRRDIPPLPGPSERWRIELRLWRGRVRVLPVLALPARAPVDVGTQLLRVVLAAFPEVREHVGALSPSLDGRLAGGEARDGVVQEYADPGLEGPIPGALTLGVLDVGVEQGV